MAAAVAAHSAAEEAERWLLTQAVHTKLAYIHLCLEDPVQALAACKRLLQSESSLRPEYRFVTRMYAAEALCWQGESEDAAEMLAPLVQAIDQDTAEEDSTAVRRMPGGGVAGAGVSGTRVCGSLAHMSQAAGALKSAASRCALHVNLAVVHMLHHRLAQAATSVKAALAAMPSSSAALLLAVYLEIRQGNREAALSILKTQRYASVP
eukprot:Tamp_23866.p1 GENE.Tamp_23866~~Tamp_23866.p1  ORF type:complete len:219 (+),score=43.94 Tamp_23866:35-658(+)